MNQNNIESYIKSIAANFSNGDCIFFIGAGISIDAGMPSAKKMALLISGKIGEKLEDLFIAAEEYIKKTDNRVDLLNIIKEEIEAKQETANTETFDLLAEIFLSSPPGNIIVTTNWDTLIEKQIRKAGGSNSLVKIRGNKDLNFLTESSGKINLIKLHGDIENVSDIKVTRQDFIEFEEDNKAVLTVLKGLFYAKKIIVIGFRGEEYYFLKMANEVFKSKRAIHKGRFLVVPDKDINNKWSEWGFRHICLSAREFFDKLNECRDKIRRESAGVAQKNGAVDEKAKKIIEKSNNPFKYIDANRIIDPKEIKEFAYPHPTLIQSLLSCEMNTIIHGSRGFGKTMLLKYASTPVQTLLKGKIAEDDSIGCYIQLTGGLFDSMKFFKEKEGERPSYPWKQRFIHYWVLVIAENIIQTVIVLLENKLLKIDRKLQLELSNELWKFIFNEDFHAPLDEDFHAPLKEMYRKLTEQRNKVARGAEVSLYLDIESLYLIVSIIQSKIPEFKDKWFRILIDDYHFLDENQQMVTNLFLKDRKYPIVFKISTNAYTLTPVDFNNNPIEGYNEVEHKYLDKEFLAFPKVTGYSDYLEKIANKRLEAAGFNIIGIKNLLPNTKCKPGKNYAGFINCVKLSSGSPRVFLALCKDFLYKRYPEKTEFIPDDFKQPIPETIQNYIILLYSEIALTEVRKISGYISENLRKFILGLGEYSKRRYSSPTKDNVPKQTIRFAIKDIENLIQEIHELLIEAVKCRLLQPATFRIPVITSQTIPFESFLLNRLLCPMFKIDLGDRWQREIPSKLLNECMEKLEDGLQFNYIKFVKNLSATLEEDASQLKLPTEDIGEETEVSQPIEVSEEDVEENG